jgi:biotin carboxylase
VDNPAQQITVDVPFWIKPVKSASSHLGFKVRNDAEFEHAIQAIRKNIFRFGKPFNYLLQFAELPDHVAAVDGFHCIAEGMISRGRQCTLEGYVYDGEVCVYGAVDSIREGKHRSSFSRYQYPSSIPLRIQEKMIAVTERFFTSIGFDNGPFNIEFYWESQRDKIWLLEINTRISKSHCPLFRHVDGASHHQVMLDLALGKRPEFPHRQGRYRYAAKFMWRIYEDAQVKRVPTEDELRALCNRFPNTEIELHVDEGMRLSELKDQDSYSYEIAVIFLGGNSQNELLQKYRAVQQALPVELAPLSRIA